MTTNDCPQRVQNAKSLDKTGSQLPPALDMPWIGSGLVCAPQAVIAASDHTRRRATWRA